MYNALYFLCCIVERRRRDRINDMIKTLAQIVPGCQKKDSTTGNVVGVSLMHACGFMLIITAEHKSIDSLLGMHNSSTWTCVWRCLA